MAKSVEALAQAKFINQTRVSTAVHGLSKCKSEMGEFKACKQERLVEKQQALVEQKQQMNTIKQIKVMKEQEIEKTRKRLAWLRKQNEESIGIEKLLAEVIKKLTKEEQWLRKLEMIQALEGFLKREKYEEPLENNKGYKQLVNSCS